jgi:D-3-phosphoglycerate dehydrogenase
MTVWEESIPERVPSRVVCARLRTHEDIASNGVGARAVILGAVEPFDEHAFGLMPELRLVARRGVGTDNVDVAAAERHGVLVTNVPDASVEEVSDQALALVLGLLRGVFAADRAMDQGRLDLARAAVDRGLPLRECTVGVIGCGRIGRRFVEKVRGVVGQVLVADPYVNEVEGADVVPLPELVAGSSAVSVHVPLTEGTRDLLDAELIGRLPPGAVVVNTSRAEVVDEYALQAALRSGAVGGAGLDVVADEQPWRELVAAGANVVLTGHTGARGARSQETLRRTCAAQVVDFLSGRTPDHVVGGLSTAPGGVR